MITLLTLLSLLFLLSILGVITSPRELQIGDEVSLKVELSNNQYTFNKGSIFKVRHIILPYRRYEDCIHLINEERQELLFIHPKYLKFNR